MYDMIDNDHIDDVFSIRYISINVYSTLRLLGQNGPVLELNIESGLISKLLFKMAP